MPHNDAAVSFGGSARDDGGFQCGSAAIVVTPATRRLPTNNRDRGVFARSVQDPGGRHELASEYASVVATVRRAAIAAALIATVVLGCAVDASNYTAILDDLAFPDDWAIARTIVRAPGAELDCTPTFMSGPCPSVTRYYHTDQTQVAAYDAAVAVVSDAGFEIAREPSCDGTSGLCAFVVTKGDVRLSVNVYPPGEDDGTLRDVAKPGLVLIRMITEGK